MAVNADRQIALEREAMPVQMAHRVGELLVEFVLQPKMIGDLRPLRLGGIDQRIHPIPVEYRPLLPAAEIGAAVVVALHAEQGVGNRPVAVSF